LRKHGWRNTIKRLYWPLAEFIGLSPVRSAGCGLLLSLRWWSVMWDPFTGITPFFLLLLEMCSAVLTLIEKYTHTHTHTHTHIHMQTTHFLTGRTSSRTILPEVDERPKTLQSNPLRLSGRGVSDWLPAEPRGVPIGSQQNLVVFCQARPNQRVIAPRRQSTLSRSNSRVQRQISERKYTNTHCVCVCVCLSLLDS